MALIYKNQTKQKCYEVRTAGNSVRLYTNGVFHSQWNARVPFNGHIWELMALPSLLLPAAPNILVLGVGGGAVIRQIMALKPDAKITGVDIDPVHISVAKKYFGVTGKNIRLATGDAVEWVHSGKTDKYHLIIDDLFGDATLDPSLPSRAVALTSTWLKMLKKRLTAGGLLVANTEQLAQARGAKKVFFGTSTASNQVGVLQAPKYENAIGVYTFQQAILKQLQPRAKIHPLTRRMVGKVSFKLYR